MSYVNGMKPGPDLGSKPSGNSSSLVPEIRGRGVVGKPVPACNRGKKPDIKMSTNVRNTTFQDLYGTGLS